MSRFRGVATRYLPNYLMWHQRVDAHERQGVAGESLRWPDPCLTETVDGGLDRATNNSREHNTRQPESAVSPPPNLPSTGGYALNHAARVRDRPGRPGA